jgi:hypothetical protein
MATSTVKSEAPNLQRKRRAEPGTTQTGEPATTPEAKDPTGSRCIYRCNRVAFQVWLICAAVLALVVLYDLLTGLFMLLGQQLNARPHPKETHKRLAICKSGTPDYHAGRKA